ncbi:MAG: hypothetical protein AMXMBFR81_21710 [Chthonomonas sp.]
MTLAACIATLLALAYADQPTSRTEPFTEGVAILAPLDAVADARKLWLAEDRDDLAKRASSLGYRLLETKAIDRDTVNLMVHADYVEQGGYALAVEVAKYLKGRDPLRTLDLADFPEQLRAALEPAFRTLAGGSLGANRSMRFAIEPLLYVGVEDPTAPPTIGAPSLYDLAPNLSRPATHPSRLDGGRDGSRNTDIHSSFVAQTKAEAASLENATVVYLRASNDISVPAGPKPYGKQSKTESARSGRSSLRCSEKKACGCFASTAFLESCSRVVQCCPACLRPPAGQWKPSSGGTTSQFETAWSLCFARASG